jgi:hypothetical protein
LKKVIYLFVPLLFVGGLFFSTLCLAQNAVINGKVTDSDNQPIESATVFVIGSQKGVVTSPTGTYSLNVPTYKKQLLVAQILGFKPDTVEFLLVANETKTINFVLKSLSIQLTDVQITDNSLSQEDRQQAGTTFLSPKSLKNIPTPFLDFNQAIISAGLGVVGNNELSSAYAVRGGNFDENLVYVNNMQVYRPFLVRAGQQEGLSFINPDMVKSVEFSSGGWQAKYGDKLASVLSVDYRQAKRLGVSAQAGLLGGSLTVDAAPKNSKFTIISGVRYKDSRYLLGTLPVTGQYLPRFVDWQNHLTYDMSRKHKPAGTTSLSLIMSYAANNYSVIPVLQETTFGTIQQAFRLRVDFQGRELMFYDTYQGGLKLSHRINQKLLTQLLISGVTTREREFFDIEAGYRLCDVDINPASPDPNKCISTRGLGTNYHYGRNFLDAQMIAVETRNEYLVSEKWNIAFGVRYDKEMIKDQLNEYQFTDSADFVNLTSNYNTSTSLSSHRVNAYVQSTHYIDSVHSFTYGVRLNHWSLNGQMIISPRFQYAYKPRWKNDIVFNTATGLYAQPAFYREMRSFSGTVNTNLRAQQSWHVLVGMNYQFKLWDRPFKLTSEAYYKNMWDVVAYDVDNVRLRYYANNDATGFAYGTDVRIAGEFVKGMESWFNIGYLNTQENVGFDERDYVRRPTDQRITAAIFFQDYVFDNPTLQMSIRLLYGSGLPYGPPNNPAYRNALSGGNTYNRVDLALTKVIIYNSKAVVAHRSIETLSIALEVLNLFAAPNNISFTWVKDFENNSYAVPNALSQRFFNIRMIFKY